MRTLLHLHPEDPPQRHELLIRQRDWLRERDLQLVLAAESLAPTDRDVYADAIELPPPQDVSGTLSKLRPFASRHRVAAILAQSEWAAAPASLLARELALPGPSPESTLRCLAKHQTRAALASARLPQPEFTLASDAAAVRRFARQHGFPLMLKALASTMSRLVTRVDDDDAIEPAVARVRAGLAASPDLERLESFVRAASLEIGADPRASFLCERFCAGDPLETDGFVVAGRARAFGVLEQVLTAVPALYLEAYLMPADRPAAERAAIQSIGEQAAAAVGLDAAGFSVELRAEGGARVIEVNGRLGEDDGLHRLFELASGADPFRIAVAVALGEPPPPFAPRDAPRHALAYQCSFADGVVQTLPGAADIAALAGGGVEAGLCVTPGTRMRAPPHPETWPHIVWLLATDPASSRAAFERARSLVRSLRFTLVQSPPP